MLDHDPETARKMFAACGVRTDDKTNGACICLADTMMRRNGRNVDSARRLVTELNEMRAHGGPVPDDLVHAAGACAD